MRSAAMRERAFQRDTTRLLWDEVFRELKCEKCQAILYWNFGFRRCPYCHRKIEKVEQRRI